MRPTTRLLTILAVLSLATTAALAKAPSKKLMEKLVQYAVSADAVFQPPSGEPSPAAGSFVQAYKPPPDEEPNRDRIGTYDVSTSSCTKHLKFKKVAATEKRSTLMSLDVGIASKLGLAPVGLDIGGSLGHKVIAGMEYELTEKMILDGGQDEMTRCCVENPAQCTDEIISEWWAGTGKIHRLITTNAGLKATLANLEESGMVNFGMSKGFTMNSEWSTPQYFAYRTQRLRLPSCEEYLNSSRSDTSSIAFTGVGEFKDTEQDARRDAREEARRLLVESLAQDYYVEGDKVQSYAEALIGGVMETLQCVERDETGPMPQFKARAQMRVDKAEFEAAVQDLESRTR